MRQILQNLKSGETYLEEVPAPRCGAGSVLIRTHRSLVSLGTERMVVEFGRANLLSKARQQPEKVKMVLDKMKSDGIMPTLEAVFNKLDEPLPLGYCNAGEVIEVGRGLEGEFKVGDRVVSNGAHAEIVCVPRKLVARIPDNVSYDEAAFTVAYAIGLQGIRLLNPTFGETVVVMGLGLIGLLTAELLVANGTRVIGFDFDRNKVGIASAKGVEAIALTEGSDPVQAVLSLTGGVGADGVIITASAKSNAIVSQAAGMSRKRGRIILVGVVGLELNRSEFYEKELSFQVSCSYGPGRYDEAYERKGIDYPLPFVRWTENRNFQAVLSSMAAGRLDVKPLISEVVDFEYFSRIYGDLGGGGKIASLLRYGPEPAIVRSVQLREPGFVAGKGGLALVGAGNFTKMTVLPALKKAGLAADAIVSSGGVTGTTLARKYGISRSTTDYETVLRDPGISGVIITTRHNLHASMTLRALRAGKHVLVEKPLCLKREELEEIRAEFGERKTEDGGRRTESGERRSEDGVGGRESGEMDTPHPEGPPLSRGDFGQPTLTVGFNRRFSAHVRKMKALLGNRPGPMNVVATFNAGAIPADHWIHDPSVGGGRIVGEACHFIDLISYLTGSSIVAVCASPMGGAATKDNASIFLRFENGSHGVVNYFSTGHKSCPKERVEVYSENRNLVLDNFRELRGYGFKGFRKLKLRQDKGHAEQFRLFAEQIRSGGEPLIPVQEVLQVTDATFAALESIQSGGWVSVGQKANVRQEDLAEV